MNKTSNNDPITNSTNDPCLRIDNYDKKIDRIIYSGPDVHGSVTVDLGQYRLVKIDDIDSGNNIFA